MTPDHTTKEDLCSRFVTGAPPHNPDTPLWAPLFSRRLPQGLGPVATYDPFTTIILALAGFDSPHWAPHRHLEETLGLRLRDGARPTHACYWKLQGQAPPRLVTYPLFNLDQTVGDKSAIVTLDPLPDTTPAKVSQAVRHLLSAMPAGPATETLEDNAPPAYDIHTDTLTLSRTHLERPTPESDWRLLQALVAATARSTARILFPPARELFVSGLAAAAVARDCGFTHLPAALPGEAILCRNWILQAGDDLFRAALDALQADESARGWAGRHEATEADYDREHALAQP